MQRHGLDNIEIEDTKGESTGKDTETEDKKGFDSSKASGDVKQFLKSIGYDEIGYSGLTVKEKKDIKDAISKKLAEVTKNKEAAEKNNPNSEEHNYWRIYESKIKAQLNSLK